ncbi:hypothetical protein K435DRAFT_676883 [Dendrothele bispora CBS 962.96]|uniref:F-box domain-containing protein n=1 Tax=Dendrothele bispora (strain CBS 962.96) TaxID=1314807 RepID=A0A4S8LLM9_DENBC|nr:hypothetical protein K435DRAFT_676883 [Dendrothele bispora CBS 962.96]
MPSRTTSNVLAPSFDRILPSIIQKAFKRHSPCYSYRMDPDTWIDGVFPHLKVEDIIRMRRVSKYFYLLTHEPIIWKNFLKKMTIPLPPIRPSFRYTYEPTSFEVEQLVTRAIWTDDTYRKWSPKLRHQEIIFACYQVLEMILLPGGKFLVASVTDFRRTRFFIQVFSLDHPSHEGKYALAKRPVTTKAFNLRAKFMKYKGKQGIMIMFSMRKPGVESEKPKGYDPSEWSARTEIDPPEDLLYECLWEHVLIDSLEFLTDPWLTPGSEEHRRRAESLPPPFELVMHFASNTPAEHPSLFEADGRPFSAIFQRPDEICIFELEERRISSMRCKKNTNNGMGQCVQKIMAFRVIPAQNEILVVRTIHTTGWDHLVNDTHTIELYTVPGSGSTGVLTSPVDEPAYIEGKFAESFHISEDYIPPIGPEFPNLYDAKACPPPISIFMRTVNPRGVMHYDLCSSHLIVGHQQDAITGEIEEIKEWVYRTDWAIPQSTHVSEPVDTRIIPGVHRALMYTVPGDDRTDEPHLLALRRYHNPLFPGSEYPHTPYGYPEPEDEVIEKRYKRPTNLFCNFKVDSPYLDYIKEQGFTAIAWDESIGRVCIATPKDMHILVLDVGKMTEVWNFEKFQVGKWQRVQGMAQY